MYNRVHDAGLRIARLKKDGFYKMAKHADEVKNPEAKRLFFANWQTKVVLTSCHTNLPCFGSTFFHLFAE